MAPVFSPIHNPIRGPIFAGLTGRYGGSRVDPAIVALFQPGVRGFAFTPWDITTLFQDAAGTIPVTADGDQVGLMKDVSGNGNHATSTGTKRPLYKTSGGLSWLQPDATDDSMLIASLALSTTHRQWIAYNQTVGTSMFFFEHGPNANTNAGMYFQGSSAATWVMNRGLSNTAGGSSQWANGLHVVESSYVAGATGTYSKDGVVQANGAVSGTVATEIVTTTAYNLFSRNQASLFCAGQYFGHILADGSAATNTAIYNLLKGKAGL